MKKHRVLKAFILVVVMFFHSFVLVPKAYSTAWGGAVGRLAFRAVAPATIAAMSSATSIVAPIFIAGMVGYVVYKSNAIDALKSWWNAGPGAPIYPAPTTEYSASNLGAGFTASVEYMSGAWRVRTYNASHGNTGNFADWWTSLAGYGCGPYNGNTSNNAWLCVAALDGAGGSQIPTPVSPPAVVTDYATALASSQPSFPSQSVYASPGMVTNLTGAEAVGAASQMSDTDAQAFINAAGLTAVDTASQTQDGFTDAVPADNGATGAFPAAAMALLDAIKSNTGSSAQSLEAIKSQGLENTSTFPIAAQNALDNIAINTAAQSLKMDNAIGAIGAQTQILEGIETKVESIDNTLTQAEASQSTIQTRIQSLRDLAATKFPFSYVLSISVAEVSGQSEYNFDPLPLTPIISIQIDPMAGPLGSLFVWVRQLLVWFLWAGTLFAMLRKVMEM